MSYKLTQGWPVRVQDGASVNPQSDEYLAWLASGGVPAPADPVVTIAVVNPWQIRKALNATGLRAAVEAAVSVGDQTTKDAWLFAQEFRRDHPLVTSVASALGKTDAEIDAVFALAQTL